MAEMIPKVLGADVELANFFVGVTDRSSAAEAARELLQAFAKVTGAVGRFEEHPRDHHDWARFFLPSNGGCAYIDAHHLELCTGEQRGAHDFVAAWQGMLVLAQQALYAANEARGLGRERVQALVNNSDGRVSYGSHLNVLVTRRIWHEILERKPHYLAVLASYQAASLVLTGQGAVVGTAGDRPAPFELSQRAPYLESLIGPQTTYHRPLVNTRDEAHCGRWNGGASDCARLHVIAYDSSLCDVGTLAKVGGLQLLLAMLEAGVVPTDLALDDPVGAARAWSADPTLEQPMALLDGREVTAVELQSLFTDRMRRFADHRLPDGVVPRAADILMAWETTLGLLIRRDWPALGRRLDWALKLGLIERAMRHRPDLDWDSPAIGYLDQIYASLDPHEGLYWASRRGGGVDQIVTPADIERAAHQPAEDTRAWARAHLLRRAAADQIDQVDWDHIRFRLAHPGKGVRTWRVDLPSPLSGTKAELEATLQESGSLGELLETLGAELEPESTPAPITYGWSWSQPGRRYDDDA